MPQGIKNDLQGLVISDNYEWLAIREYVKLPTCEIILSAYLSDISWALAKSRASVKV